MNSFEDAGLSPELVRAVEDLGFVTPTPIQAQTIPQLLSSDRDVVALAQTGTGKTAAFGLPALQMTDAGEKYTQTLVLCPTRELCIQIVRDLDTYSKYLKKLKVLAVYGGTSIDTQIRALRDGAQIVVGTPGRTLDLIKRRKLKLDRVARVVLDEADEMLSMGFQEDLDAILSHVPEPRQTLLFSATMSDRVMSIARKYMDNPARFSVARTNAGAENITHGYYMVQAKDRYALLKRLVDMNPGVYGIVFCRTRKDTKEVAAKLMHDGYQADAIHGDLSQSQRDDVMNKFRKRQLQLLVATDVAARGLDVNDLTHVINYNLPDDPEVYVHRSGRTGRAGKSGASLAIIHSREHRKIRDIERTSGIKFEKLDAPSGMEICQTQLLALIDKVKAVDVDEKQIKPFLPEIYKKLESLDRESLIQHFVSMEFNRFLGYYKDARDLNVTTSKKSRKEDRKGDRDGRRGGSSRFKRLFVNIGKRDGLNPARLIGLVNECFRSDDFSIGKIEVLKNFSFIEIESDMADVFVKSSKGMEFEGVPVNVEHAEELHGRGGKRDSAKRNKRKKRFSGSGFGYSERPGGRANARKGKGRDRSEWPSSGRKKKKKKK